MARRERLGVVNVAASHRLNYLQIGKCIYPRFWVDGDGEDGPVVLMTDKVFGGAVLIRRSPSRP
jgi:hypothetical protein